MQSILISNSATRLSSFLNQDGDSIRACSSGTVDVISSDLVACLIQTGTFYTVLMPTYYLYLRRLIANGFDCNF